MDSSNTIPTDVINFSQTLQVKDPVRVLVRREGSSNSQESVSSVTPGINLKHTYVYLTITGSARSEASTDGPGTIGSGRLTNGQMSEEASKAKEYKLDTLVKMLDDYPLWQAVIHVGTNMMLEAVVMRLASRNWETLYLVSPSSPPPRESKADERHQQCPNHNEKRSYNNGVHPHPTPDLDSWCCSTS
jgi:translation initiation factor 4A